MGELVTIPNVTLIETGTWQASTGEVTFTSADLYAAVAALDDPAVKTPRMRFGHTMPTATMAESAGGFDDQPCVGKFTNLRVINDGNALEADLVGVPAWLAEILPIAYPNRSVEAYFDVSTATGKKHGLVITSVALLGESLPAVQTLDDLELLFSDEGSQDWIEALTGGEMVAASRPTEEESMPQRVAAAVAQGDLRKGFYDQVATEESGRYWWWLHQVYLDPQIVIAEDDEGEFQMVPYSFESDGVQFADPVKVFIQWVEEESGKVAASVKIPEHFGKPERVYASAPGSRPAVRQQQFNHKKEAKGSMPIDTSLLIQRLGLPEDATEEQINEALAAETPTPTPPTPEVETVDPPENPGETVEVTETEPVTEPVAVAASGVTVDAETWAQIQRDAAAGRLARDEQIKVDRNGFVSAAVKAGKIPPARKAHYLSLMEKDDKGTREFINSLAEGSVPVTEIGTSESPETTARAQGTGLFPELTRQEA